MPEKGKKGEPASRRLAMTQENESLVRQIDAVKRALLAKKVSQPAGKGGSDDFDNRTKKD